MTRYTVTVHADADTHAHVAFYEESPGLPKFVALHVGEASIMVRDAALLHELAAECALGAVLLEGRAKLADKPAAAQPAPSIDLPAADEPQAIGCVVGPIDGAGNELPAF